MIEKIDGRTRLCGVVGNPIEHTFSPLIHNTLAGRCGQNLVYTAFNVKENLDKAIEGAYALNILGMNITVPYKSEVMKSLVDIDEAAKIIGAVNTLVRVDGGYKGYNTDYLGLKRAMEEDGIVIKDKPVILFGAGGAARAAAFLAGSLGAKELYIVNRTKEKAEKLADDISNIFSSKTKNKESLSETDIECQNSEFIVKALASTELDKLPDCKFTAIQTTNAGMWPNTDMVCIDDENTYKKIDMAVDIIFNPKETLFMKNVKKHGGKAVNGLKMLLYQGIIAYELWNDIEVPNELAVEIYDIMKKEFEH